MARKKKQPLNQAEQYAADVLSGKEIACKFVIQMVQRHQKDLQRKRFAYEFSPGHGEAALAVMRMLKHSSGTYAGKPFGVQPFQAFMVWCIFGWRVKKTGYRRFQTAYIETAKKSGKSEFAAAIIWIANIMEGQHGAQNYIAATTRDQAMHVFRAAKAMGKYLRLDSKWARKEIALRVNRVVLSSTESFIQPLSADYNSLDGINPFTSTIDEYMAHKTSFVSDTMQNAQVAQDNPWHLTITTAGFDTAVPCYSVLRKSAVNILSGLFTDDRMFTAIYTLDDGDDWRDIKVWPKANPNIGRTTALENLIMLRDKAINEGSTKEVDFKTKNLNIWVTSKDTWIPDHIWEKTARPNWSEMEQKVLAEGGMVFGGMDLGQTRDLTNLALLLDPDMLGEYYFKVFTWCSEETVKLRHEAGDPYLQWQSEGWITPTPGNVTDYDYVKTDIINLNEMWRMVKVGYDPYNSTQLVINLNQEGVQMNRFSQGMLNMNGPTREFEELAYKGSIATDGNPLLRWAIGNVEIQRDGNGNIKVSKKDRNKKVDPVVACVMALGEYMNYKASQNQAFKYGLRFV
jgi:phage terminase large subunit-like protein